MQKINVEEIDLSFCMPYFQVIEPKMKQIPVDQEKLRSYRVIFYYLYSYYDFGQNMTKRIFNRSDVIICILWLQITNFKVLKVEMILKYFLDKNTGKRRFIST